MSLDTIELVMEMEETFGIVIDDLDAEKIGTVGQAYRYILGKLELRQASPCPSAELFYRLRRALMVRSGADRRSIHPSTRIDAFLPATGRRGAWLGLGGELGVGLPRLSLALWQSRLALAIGLGSGIMMVGVAMAVVGIRSVDAAPAIAMGAVFTALGWATAYHLLLPFASTIPRGCETIQGVVLGTLGRHFTPPVDGQKTWHPDEVWVTLRELVANQLGVPRDEVTEEKHFVYDFGMD